MSHEQDYDRIKANMEPALSGHVLYFLLDQEEHRCILFKNPGTSEDHFYITTWPGHLAISGDRGDYMFNRLNDMFEFFRGRRYNPPYWASKCVAGETREFDNEAADNLIKRLIEEGELDDDIVDYPSSVESVLRLLEENDIPDVCEYAPSLYKYSHHFLTCLFLIQWSIEAYDRHKEAHDQYATLVRMDHSSTGPSGPTNQNMETE